MTYLAITLVLSLPLTCWLFLRDRVKEREFWAAQLSDEAKERALLADRIQNPERAAALALTGESDGPQYVSQYTEFQPQPED